MGRLMQWIRRRLRRVGADPDPRGTRQRYRALRAEVAARMAGGPATTMVGVLYRDYLTGHAVLSAVMCRYYRCETPEALARCWHLARYAERERDAAWARYRLALGADRGIGHVPTLAGPEETHRAWGA